MNTTLYIDAPRSYSITDTAPSDPSLTDSYSALRSLAQRIADIEGPDEHLFDDLCSEHEHKERVIIETPVTNWADLRVKWAALADIFSDQMRIDYNFADELQNLLKDVVATATAERPSAELVNAMALKQRTSRAALDH